MQVWVTYSEDFTVTVSDVNEAPFNIVLSNSTIAENVNVGTVIGGLTAEDEDASESFVFRIVSGNVGLNGTDVVTVGAIDFETTPSFDFTAEVEDKGGLTFQKTFTITVTDVEEGQLSITQIAMESTAPARNQRFNKYRLGIKHHWK